VLLHEGHRCYPHIIGTGDGTSLEDADGVVGLNPLGAETAGVVGVGVLDIAGPADEILAAGEFENVEVLHVDR
jgi:hypothetical protein